MGLMAFLPVIALYVRERFGIEDPAQLRFQASVIYGAAPLAAAVVGPLWGALGDRTGKKPMAIRANVAIALTTLLMPLAPSPMVLLLMRILQGVLAGYVAPAMSLVAQGTPAGQQGSTIAKLQVAMATGSFLGPWIGAEVTVLFGRSSLFYVASALSAYAALHLHLFAHEERVVPAPNARSFVRTFVQASFGLLRQPAIGILLLLLLLLRLGQNMAEPMLSLLVRDLGAWSVLESISDTAAQALERTIALPFALLAVAQWVCTPWWGRMADRHGPLRCLAFLAVGLGVAQFAMAMVTTIGQFLAVRCVVACLMAGSMTLAYAAASNRVTDQNRTLAFAMVQSCIQYGLALGPLLGAVVAGQEAGAASFGPVFMLGASLCLVAGLSMLVLRAATAGRPTSPASTPPDAGSSVGG